MKKPIINQKVVQKMNNLSIKGLTQKELKTYLDLLSLKKATVLELAKISNLKRATLYRLLDQLIQTGLVSQVYEGKKRYYIAESPEKLLYFLNEQKRKIKEILPKLKTLEEMALERPKIRFYEGKEGIKTLYNEILKEGAEIIGFSWPDKLFQMIQSFPELVKRRVKLKIPIRLIMPDTKLARQRKKLGEEELRQIKLLSDFQPFEIIFLATGKKVIMFSLKRWFVGILIENKEIAEGLKSFFEAFWKRLK